MGMFLESMLKSHPFVRKYFLQIDQDEQVHAYLKERILSSQMKSSRSSVIITNMLPNSIRSKETLIQTKSIINQMK